jgi:hypothetical protein
MPPLILLLSPVRSAGVSARQPSSPLPRLPVATRRSCPGALNHQLSRGLRALCATRCPCQCCRRSGPPHWAAAPAIPIVGSLPSPSLAPSHHRGLHLHWRTPSAADARSLYILVRSLFSCRFLFIHRDNNHCNFFYPVYLLGQSGWFFTSNSMYYFQY